MTCWYGHLRPLILLILLFPVLLTGCGDEADIYPPNWIYNVTIVNLTDNHPFSPVIGIVHTEGYSAWEVNTPASEELERYAEGQEAEQLRSTDVGKWLLTEASDDPKVVLTRVSSVIEGRNKVELGLSVPADGYYFVTLLARLAFTNDGFTGVSALPVYDLGLDEKKSLYLSAYDAGTEKNDETKEHVAGFAEFELDDDGNVLTDDFGIPIVVEGIGEGYNADRDDGNLIIVHPGVISKDETDPAKQIEGSDLVQSQRFKQPVAKIIIERTR